MDFSSSSFGIISNVQIDDMHREEARIVEEREARRVLRLQAKGADALSASELVAKLAGSEAEQSGGESNASPGQEVSSAPRTKSSFPAPPKTASTGG